MRIRVPKGAALGAHWHPREERVTVLSGEVRVGFGDVPDRAATRRFTGGGFYVNPPNSHHYLFFDSESVLQITGVGPWQIHFVGAPD
jgi:quercetin dioxygenase-like cupin family protein